MKRLLISGLVSLTLAPAVLQAQPQLTYENHGIVTAPLTINAVNFVNFGSFGSPGLPIIFNQVLPFETFNTRNYTNFGTMFGTVMGWRFAYTPSDPGPRGMAGNFVNNSPGLISATDTANGATPVFQNCVLAPVFPSFLFVSASNILTGAGSPAQGSSLQVGANGDLMLEGRYVNVAYSGLEVIPIWAEPIGTVTDNTNFIPDLGIWDLYWVQANFTIPNPLRSAGLWNGTSATSQGVNSPPTQPQAAPSFQLVNPFADSYITSEFTTVTITNFTGSPTNVTTIDQQTIQVLSNVVKGAVFVGVPPGFSVNLGFSPSTQPNNDARTIEVLISTDILNRVKDQFETAFIYVTDTLASDTLVRGNAQNLVGCSADTFRPAPYQVSRLNLFAGASGDGTPEPLFFLNSGNRPANPIDVSRDTVTNSVLTTGDYAAYAAVLDNIVSRLPAVAGAAITNLPGRVRIYADTLDMTETRLRAEGAVVINARDFNSSTNAVIDVENFSLNLGSTNNLVKIDSIVPPFVSRLRGDILLWSANWTNQVQVVYTNNYTFTNIVTTNMMGTNIISIDSNLVAQAENFTNFFTVRYHTLMLDARSLTTILPVTVYDLVTHARDVLINDDVTVIQSLFIDGQNLTINGNMIIQGFYPPDPITGLVPPIPPVQNWAAVNAPNLLHFTNNGSFFIANQAHFGDDRPLYADFLNAGVINAASIRVNSFYFENRGTMTATESLIMDGGTGKLENGSSSSTTFSRFLANDLKFSNYQLNSGLGGLFISVTNSLSDAGTGPGVGNTFQVRDGFNLLVKPRSGDLLGTIIMDLTTNVPSVLIDHQWAGEDRGPSPSGYTDNAAIGRLILAPQSARPLYRFRGTGAHNGMYVDVLDLSGLSTNFLNEIQINPNLVIYFAAAVLPGGVTLPPNSSPEEFLDGKFAGRLRWVQSYAGANSSQFAVVNGQSILVNKALFNSMLIDSDNDGTVNAIDVDPGGVFQGGTPLVEVSGSGTVFPDYNSQILILGQSYTVSAVPADGWVFSGWTGSTNSSLPNLTFVMENGLNLVANFTHVLTAGTFNGLFFESGGVQFGASGALTITTTSSGKYTGSIQMGSTRSSFSGQMDQDGNISQVVSRKNNSPLTLELQVGDKHITGTVTDGDFVADVFSDRATFDGITKIASFAGRYTMIFPGSGNPADTTLPLGDGYGALTISTAGKIKMSGVLADGTKISQSATVSGDGNWALYVPYSKNKGQLLSWITFVNNGVQDFGGVFSWIRVPDVKAKLYPDGFTLSTNATGSAYNPLKVPITGFNNGTVQLSGGNLSSDIIGFVSIASNNKVTSSGGTKTSVTLNATDGTFKGSVVNPVTGKQLKFTGIILQKQTSGSGSFINSNLSGKATLRP